MPKQPTDNLILSDPQGAILAAIKPEQRKALRQRLRDGDLDEIIFEAQVFQTGPNRNHVRFRDQDMAAFAASFTGLPFLRNHNVHDIGARDGTIIDSRLVGSTIQQTIQLTTERGMRDFLDGVIDRFSIGWNFESTECSVCGKDWLRCEHWPGRRYPDPNDKDRTVVAEIIFINPQGKETSAVNAPAVDGTRVLNQLSDLKAAAQVPLPTNDLSPQVATATSNLSPQVATATNNSPQVATANHQESQTMAQPNQIVLPDGSTKTVHPAASTGDTHQPTPPSDQRPDAAPPDPEQETVSHLLAETRRMQQEILDQRRSDLIAASGLSPHSQEVVRLAAQGQSLDFTQQLVAAQQRVEAESVQRHLVHGVRPLTIADMQTPQDRIQSSLNWIFGAHDEPTPAPSMRSLRDLYQAVTGDVNWYGVFNPEWTQLAANTTTLAGMVVNALNKVIRQHYDNMATFRWYEQIVAVVPHDGTTHDVQLIMVDGLANLPTVGEGAAYTEATVGDSKESFSFAKKGNYVGITLETIRKSDIQRIQAIPREMVKASVRTRSAAIAAIFTQASGTGPTLADDSTVLFHANHGNLGTAALDATEWAAARKRIWSQTIPGTSNALGLWPTFCLVPIDLYDSALTLFGYGNGDVGKPNSAGTAQEVNPYAQSRTGDPRPIPIPVPEWSDANDWAQIVDPRLHPVIHMAYAGAPQGNQHPMPEIYEAMGETNGLMFTNDTLPVKVRDWWGYGVATYVGVGKNNVA